jgi:small ligand-binding sensory domain FIST
MVTSSGRVCDRVTGAVRHQGSEAGELMLVCDGRGEGFYTVIEG